jgi:hypothetical protein
MVQLLFTLCFLGIFMNLLRLQNRVGMPVRLGSIAVRKTFGRYGKRITIASLAKK